MKRAAGCGQREPWISSTRPPDSVRCIYILSLPGCKRPGTPLMTCLKRWPSRNRVVMQYCNSENFFRAAQHASQDDLPVLHRLATASQAVNLGVTLLHYNSRRPCLSSSTVQALNHIMSAYTTQQNTSTLHYTILATHDPPTLVLRPWPDFMTALVS